MQAPSRCRRLALTAASGAVVHGGPGQRIPGSAGDFGAPAAAPPAALGRGVGDADRADGGWSAGWWIRRPAPPFQRVVRAG